MGLIAGTRMRARQSLKDLLDAVEHAVGWLLTNWSSRRRRDLRRRDQARPRGKTNWFAEDEAALVDVLAALIVPSDETSPGAREAEVVDTIDRWVATDGRRRELYRLGLCSFDEWARRGLGRRFRELAATEQLELLNRVEGTTKEWRTPTSFGGRIRRKLAALNHRRTGRFAAIDLLPVLIRDVFRAFYTSPVSWVWLGYDGPPMPHGYPDLVERKTASEPVESAAPSEYAQPRTDRSGTAGRPRFFVCLKQVPSPECRIHVDETAGVIKEDGLVFATNEGDLYALEAALRLREKNGGEVVVLSLGARRALKTLRDGLARGADRAVHLDDAYFREADAFVTAQVLSAAVRREDVDLVLTGVESTDHAEAQVTGILAQILGWPHATIVLDVDLDGDKSKAIGVRELGAGSNERFEIDLPAVVGVQSGSRAPRFPTLSGILQAKKREIAILSAQELDVNADQPGRVGSLTEYGRLYAPASVKNTVMLDGTPDEVAESLFRRLRDDERLF